MHNISLVLRCFAVFQDSQPDSAQEQSEALASASEIQELRTTIENMKSQVSSLQSLVQVLQQDSATKQSVIDKLNAQLQDQQQVHQRETQINEETIRQLRAQLQQALPPLVGCTPSGLCACSLRSPGVDGLVPSCFFSFS
jgi:oligoendopeptidase F